ncbi:B3 domain-containing transcription factor VRN1-like [Quillaja saponaria]|uniref:B3 domain-containing transcription factor VRN1-like n=1 Tax=Quillaja saponaria TaxID=32244 RepID=A0AAD7L1R4_QUISA|nr:B3 domain-containing transcription factor VRN1-like [Quillaja saponaria]
MEEENLIEISDSASQRSSQNSLESRDVKESLSNLTLGKCCNSMSQKNRNMSKSVAVPNRHHACASSQDHRELKHHYETRSKTCILDNPIEIIELDDADALSQRKPGRNIMFQPQLSAKHEGRGKYVTNRMYLSFQTRKNLISKQEQRAVKAARKFKPKNPSFRIVLRPARKSKYCVYVPAAFSVKYLKRHESIKVENSKGNQWDVFHRPGYKNCGKELTSGWSTFYEDNNLKEGDVCIFELIERKKTVLRVTVFPVG